MSQRSGVAASIIAAIGVLVLAAVRLDAENGSPGPLAQSCGVPPAAAGAPELPQFPPGQYPVKLPPVSMLGARNDLPNPYRPGVELGTVARREEVGIDGEHIDCSRRQIVGDRPMRCFRSRWHDLRRTQTQTSTRSSNSIRPASC